MSGTKNDHTCPECKNHYSTAYSMYRHMRKVHNCDTNRSVTLYCPIENCNQSYDRYNALDTHLSHVHYADIRKEQFTFSDLQNFETWLRDITSSSKTKYIKRSCNNSYRYYRCHRSGVPKTSREKILNGEMKSSVKIGRHCPSRIIAKITERNVQVEFVPTHIGHECEIAKIPLSQKKRHDIACRLATSTRGKSNNSIPEAAAPPVTGDTVTLPPTEQQSKQSHLNTSSVTNTTDNQSSVVTNNDAKTNANHHQRQQQTNEVPTQLLGFTPGVTSQLQSQQNQSQATNSNNSSCTVPTASGIMPTDASHMITLAPMKTTGTVQDPQHQQQIAMPIHQIPQPHLMQVATTQIDSRLAHNNNSNTSMTLMSLKTPTRQELTARFEQLMAAIRSDKHASIVKAQLEVHRLKNIPSSRLPDKQRQEMALSDFATEVLETPPEYKMMFVVNKQLNMGVGKQCAQVTLWFTGGAKKIVCRGDDTSHLLRLQEQANQAQLPSHLVHDAGHTQIPAGSITVLAIFGSDHSLAPITNGLRLL